MFFAPPVVFVYHLERTCKRWPGWLSRLFVNRASLLTCIDQTVNPHLFTAWHLWSNLFIYFLFWSPSCVICWKHYFVGVIISDASTPLALSCDHLLSRNDAEVIRQRFIQTKVVPRCHLSTKELCCSELRSFVSTNGTLLPFWSIDWQLQTFFRDQWLNYSINQINSSINSINQTQNQLWTMCKRKKKYYLKVIMA